MLIDWRTDHINYKSVMFYYTEGQTISNYQSAINTLVFNRHNSYLSKYKLKIDFT